MNWANAGIPRFELKRGRLTDEERAFIASLSTSGKANARLLRVGDSTYFELMQPMGRLKASTVERVRRRIEELRNG